MRKNCPDFHHYAELSHLPVDQVEFNWHSGRILNAMFSNKDLSDRILLFGGGTLCSVYNTSLRGGSDLDFAYTLNDAKLSRHQIRAAEENMARHFMDKYIANVLPPEYDCFCIPDRPTMVTVCYESELDGHVVEIDLDFSAGYWHADPRPLKFNTIIPMKSVPVRAVCLEQAMWGKIATVHCYHHIPANKGIFSGGSRHFYDLYRLLCNGVRVGDKKTSKILHDEIRTCTLPMHNRSWARLQDMPNQIKLMPAPHVMDELRRDYDNFKKNIFGPVPEWTQIMARILKFQYTL